MENNLKIILKNPVEPYLLSLNSKLSARQAEINLKVFCHFLFKTTDFTACNWSIIDYIQVLKFMRFLDNKNLAHTTINTYLTFIKSVSKECWKQEIITIECFMHIQSIKCRKGIRAAAGRALSIREIEQLKSHFKYSKTNKSMRDNAIFALACCCGLRREEISKLSVDDISYNKMTVAGKGNKSRVIHLFGYVKDIVNSLLKTIKRKKGPIFVHIDRQDRLSEKRLTVHGIHYAMTLLRGNVKIKHFTMHDLRRTFATVLLDVGADKFAVQRLMGHSSLVTTELYDRRGEKAAIDAIKLLPF
jgi:site-specific recombinase XerD